MTEQSTVFGPQEDNRVPGELLVKLTSEGNLSVSESIPSGPIRRLTGDLPVSLGISNLDEALSELGIKSVTRVHSPVSNLTMAATGVGFFAADLAATYRLRFEDEKADLDDAARRLGRFKAVSEVSPNYFRWSSATPNDPMYTMQWGLVKINCPAAWDRTKGSASVVVAVVDSGVDLDHPDLTAHLLPGYDAVDLVGVAPKLGWHFEGDYLTRDNSPQDEVGHGTHVAGTIAAVTNNAVGVAGVTWFCKILPVKVLARMVKNNTSPPVVTGVGTAVDIGYGIRWAADHGAHIINLSLGGYTDTFVERDAVAYAVSKGCLVVAAMGNENTNTPSYPAAYPDVVAVGAIDDTEKRVWFSNYGPHIDVAAPGANIRSTDWDNSYSNKSGTSMASPHVAGVAALLKSCKSSLTAAEMANILRETAKPLRDNPSDPVPNDYYGHGLVNAQAAVERACGPVPLCKPYAARPLYCLPYGSRPSLCFPYAARPAYCYPYAARPGMCPSYTIRPRITPLAGPMEGEYPEPVPTPELAPVPSPPIPAPPYPCLPYGPIPYIPCSPYTGRPWIPCSPYTGRPWIPCSPYTGRPWIPCLPYTGRPSSMCGPSTPQPIVCPGGGPQPIVCPGGGPQPVVCPGGGPQPVVCPGGGPQPIVCPGGGPQPVVCPGGGPQPITPCPGGGAQPVIGPPVGPPVPGAYEAYGYGWDPYADPYAAYGGWGYDPYQAYGGWGYDPSQCYGQWGEYDPGAEYGYGDWNPEDWSGFDPGYG